MVWLLIYYTLEIFKWLIIVRAIMSWFIPPYSRNPIVDFVRRATDPILRPISNVLPNAGGLYMISVSAKSLRFCGVEKSASTNALQLPVLKTRARIGVVEFNIIGLV